MLTHYHFSPILSIFSENRNTAFEQKYITFCHIYLTTMRKHFLFDH